MVMKGVFKRRCINLLLETQGSMTKKFVIVFYLLLSFQTNAQTENKITTIDDFFAGIPVKAGFEKWVEYLYKHPHMGLDSANYRGSYSSLKPGIKSHFPFPDSVQIKILAEDKLIKIQGIDTLIRQQELLVQASFTNKKTSERNAWKCFEELKKTFKNYYRRRNSFVDAIYYSEGKTSNFPPFILQIEYSNKLGIYYVIIRAGEETKLTTEK
jgi:hypothetical protein